MSESISCVPINIQSGQVLRKAHTEVRRLRPWRCDLTALSRVYNLYFVAVAEAIYIYQPSFPTQELAAEPALVLHPPVSDITSGGYIDPQTPHTINRVHVDYLGQEEVVLVACDDGDVVGYYVSQIQDAIQPHAEGKSPRKEETPKKEETPQKKAAPRQFFQENVGRSAWGLAVHRRARLIAIGSNLHKVTVFAMDTTSDRPSPMTLETVHNVPSISFDNNGSDPFGTRLLGCDISGDTYLWDLSQSQESSLKVTIRVKCCTRQKGTQPCTCGQFEHGIWGAIFVDPPSCHPSSSMIEAFDVQPKIYHWADGSKTFWNLPHLRERRVVPRALLNAPTYLPIPAALASLNDDDGDANLSPGGMFLGIDDDDDDDNLHQPGGMFTGVDDDDDDDDDNLHQPGDMLLDMIVDDDEDDDDGGSISDLDTDGNHTVNLPLPSKNGIPWPQIEIVSSLVSSLTEDRDPNRCMPPIIILSKEQIYLMQPGYENGRGMPVIVMKRPTSVFPRFPPPFQIEPSSDSLKYSHYISELGIVIVAVPSYRCAIFTLTRLDTPNPIYGFKLSYLLPMDEQHATMASINLPPNLVGVAVGPIQGALDQLGLDPPGKEENRSRLQNRTWRLMLTYNDRTTLSYELKRRRTAGKLGVADLKV